MSRIRYVDGKEVAEWSEKQLGLDNCSAKKAIGIVVDDVLRASVLFTDYRGTSVDMHVISDGKSNWCFKGFLHLLFSFAFNTLNVERVTAPISSANTKARCLVEKLGFKTEAVLSRADNGNDRILYVLWKHESKWGV